MGHSALRENLILGAMSGPSSTMVLLVPLYMGHLGYEVQLIGFILAITSAATLAARFAVPRLYRPERSRILLIVMLTVGGVTFGTLPYMPGLLTFVMVMVVNRAAYGIATTCFLARYLDALSEGTNRRAAMGYFGGVQAAGYTTSNALVGLLADFISFEAAFLYGTVFSLFAVALLFGARALPPRQLASTPAHPTGPRAWLREIRDPGLWGVLNGNFWNTVFHTVLISFFPVYAVGIGMGPAQVGLARAIYSTVNAVARPIAGLVMGRFSLMHTTVGGLVVQAIILASVGFVDSFGVIAALFLVGGTGRAVVLVANSAALAEDVDETHVSRGSATSTYTATQDVAGISSPAAGGLMAGAIGTGGMFVAVGSISLVAYLAGCAVVARWRAQVRNTRVKPF
ncbi:MAG: arabinose transporter permease [Chloroflexi bacterium]|nr:arabinose transporter permease [Chloroflexota bacterium]